MTRVRAVLVIVALVERVIAVAEEPATGVAEGPATEVIAAPATGAELPTALSRSAPGLGRQNDPTACRYLPSDLPCI